MTKVRAGSEYRGFEEWDEGPGDKKPDPAERDFDTWIDYIRGLPQSGRETLLEELLDLMEETGEMDGDAASALRETRYDGRPLWNDWS
jgi:hypothetical protein